MPTYKSKLTGKIVVASSPLAEEMAADPSWDLLPPEEAKKHFGRPPEPKPKRTKKAGK